MVKTAFPDMKMLFTSGYTEDTITRHEVLRPVSSFAQTLHPGTLARKVRQLLDDKKP